MNADQQLTSALRGSIPPTLAKSGINHLRALTYIFNATKEGYDEREQIKSNKATVHSPRVPMVSPPPRVAIDKNLPNLVPTDTSDSDSDDEGGKNESNRLGVACPRTIVVPLKAQATPLPPILDYRNYITQDEEISHPARNTLPQSTILSIMDEVMLSCCQMSRTSYQIDQRKAASRKYP